MPERAPAISGNVSFPDGGTSAARTRAQACKQRVKLAVALGAYACSSAPAGSRTSLHHTQKN